MREDWFLDRFVWLMGWLLMMQAAPTLAEGVTPPQEPAALSRSFWSLSIQDADTGEELVGLRSHHLMTPASTMKLVSTATLWSQKGGAGRIATEIRTDGTVNNHILEGHLYIVGFGDPSIGSRYFWNADRDLFFKEVGKALRGHGISAIKGDVIALSPAADFQADNPRWLAYDMGNAYATGSRGLNAYDNSYTVTISDYGRRLSVEPDLPHFDLSIAYETDPQRRGDSLYISPFKSADGSYAITGVYPANAKRLRLRGAIPDPPLFVAHRTKSLLGGMGISVNGSAATTATIPASTQLLYTFQSPRLRELVGITLVYSHNLFAEGLLRQLTYGKEGMPGHNATQTAIEEVKRYWQGRGLQIEELEMMDGSGLSPENRVSAHFLAALLGKVHRADPSGAYMRLLPRAGLDGTLAIFLKNTPLQGKAYLKSGTLRNVVCYAGYVQLGEKTYTVALMVNNFYGKASTVRKGMEQVLLEAFGF
ncbi:MAG: D-alanyl-D-alanine carboxypeptidase/D-alanyl-D-alanine-endopeptidase [Porphyromonas sp.]|nr:D-alanyl-D-alanine carboxypeptidase/D-alanyl-D-alanine-endopeptidase [Porphyromonas sp.]